MLPRTRPSSSERTPTSPLPVVSEISVPASGWILFANHAQLALANWGCASDGAGTNTTRREPLGRLPPQSRLVGWQGGDMDDETRVWVGFGLITLALAIALVMLLVRPQQASNLRRTAPAVFAVLAFIGFGLVLSNPVADQDVPALIRGGVPLALLVAIVITVLRAPKGDR